MARVCVFTPLRIHIHSLITFTSTKQICRSFLFYVLTSFQQKKRVFRPHQPITCFQVNLFLSLSVLQRQKNVPVAMAYTDLYDFYVMLFI